MSDFSDSVKALFVEAKVAITGDIVRDEESNDVYVQTPLSVGSDGVKSPSRTQLLGLKAAAEVLGFRLHVLLVSGLHEEFESLLRATLFLAFPDVLRNVFCSLGVRTALVWVEPKQDLSPELKKSIESAARKFCEVQDFGFLGLVTVGEANTPNKLAVLSTLREIAPANAEKLLVALTAKEFAVPSQDWLARRLDVYRRAKNVVFNADKTYALTIQSFRQLGTTKRGSTSPDVTRLLALWREYR